jgi:hypothetical protein
VSLPIQSNMKRCVLNDAGQVVYYLHATNSALQDNGAAADLTGAAGQVMVEIPEHYRKFEQEGTKQRCLLSAYALPGFTRVPKTYISAYEAALDRTNLKLSSVVNTTTQYRGGNNNSAYDALDSSLLGMLVSNLSLTNFRTYARNRGLDNWNCQTYEAYKTLYWLYIVEYANLNSQLTYNAALTSEGYRQGGLGAGVTTLNSTLWSNWNAYNPFIPCGFTNSLGNQTGVAAFNMPDGYGATLLVGVPSYRGIENPFGHVWKWTDGCKCRIQSDDAGGVSEFYVCTDPSKFQDSNYSDYEIRGNLPRSDNYVKSICFGEHGDIVPLLGGASGTTYFCDYLYSLVPSSGESLRGLIGGGNAVGGAAAGLVYWHSGNAPSNAFSYIGSRLCFLTA